MPEFSHDTEVAVTPAGAYRDYLFHTGCMQTITRFEAVGREGIVAVLESRYPAQWLLDPVMLDPVPSWQSSGPDCISGTALPSAFRSYRRYSVPNGSPSDVRFRCCVLRRRPRCMRTCGSHGSTEQ